MTRISYHNCDEDHQLRCPAYFCSTAQVPLPIASACRQGNSEEKKNCSIFAPFNYFSQTLSVLFKHFSQFSSLSRMFPNPRLPLRLLNEDIMLLLFCLSTSFAHILFKFKPWFPRGVRIEEVFSNWQLNFQQMWKSETSEEGGMGGNVRVNQGMDFFKLPPNGQRLGHRSDPDVSGIQIKGGVMYRAPLSTTKHAVKLCLLTRKAIKKW